MAQRGDKFLWGRLPWAGAGPPGRGRGGVVTLSKNVVLGVGPSLRDWVGGLELYWFGDGQQVK